MLPLSMDEHSGCSKNNRKERSTNKHAHDMSENAILESKLMLVKFDPRLSFFTHTKGLS